MKDCLNALYTMHLKLLYAYVSYMIVVVGMVGIVSGSHAKHMFLYRISMLTVVDSGTITYRNILR